MSEYIEESEMRLDDIDFKRVYSKEAWMMTFVDLLSLMLVFFILDYSTSSVKENDWDKISSSFSEAFQASKIVSETKNLSTLGVSGENLNIGTDLDYVNAVFENKIIGNDFLKDKIRMELLSNELRMYIVKDVLFNKDGGGVTDDASEVLFTISDVLQSVSNKIDIIGYVDKGYNADGWNNTMEHLTSVVEELGKYMSTSKIDVIIESKKPDSSIDEGGLESTGKDTVDIVIRRYIRAF